MYYPTYPYYHEKKKELKSLVFKTSVYDLYMSVETLFNTVQHISWCICKAYRFRGSVSLKKTCTIQFPTQKSTHSASDRKRILIFLILKRDSRDRNFLVDFLTDHSFTTIYYYANLISSHISINNQGTTNCSSYLSNIRLYMH
ncbi:uncharacterized protein LOC106882415 [Octopus bimaculoides]|uniref:Uncharacterized protein n=1 Tax=Octopus bimaculoides TaxID=37653 RepID=A0A0L8FMB5_OCTBM|nr:uncharacterized protein LOC106882415 [Octopus bimaculoides]|eukprot:XP_014788572.1 PREDICTED: uncharacterized protein LOC106882415 [Octopus bimaculoides]